MRFLQKWKKAKEAKKKEKDTLAQTMVEGLNDNLKKSSDSGSEGLDDEPKPSRLSFKDSFNFHNGNFCNFVRMYTILNFLCYYGT